MNLERNEPVPMADGGGQIDHLPEEEQPQLDLPQHWPQHDQPQPLMLRRASISSLDECSQKIGKSSSSSSPCSDFGVGTLCLQSSSKNALPYKNSEHAYKTLQGLRALQVGRQFTDVTLVSKGIEVHAHKNVLAACSPYFYAMFTSFEESRQNRVTLGGDVDPEALRTLIDYIYTSKINVSEENVQTLLMTSNILQLHDVKDACCEFLLNQLHPTNALGIKAFSDLHGCLDLFNQAVNFIESHFTEVLESEEFLSLGPEQVAELISSDTITVSSEEKVYESVMNWIQYDLETRSRFLPDLMEHVRLPLVTKEYLLKVNSNEIFISDPKCKDYINEAIIYHLFHGDPTKFAFSPQRIRPRQPVGLPKVLLAIGGQAPKAIRSIECYDFKEDRWCSVTDLESRRCRCGVAVVKGKVYAVGGFNGHLRVRSVDEWDPVKDIWTPVASMEARRSTLGVAVLEDRIYAVGGFDGSTGLNSAEVLDLSAEKKEWKQIASMSIRRSSVGVGVLGGLLYAVGGYDGNSRQCLSSVEIYNPETDTWTPVAEMSARRSGVGVGVLNGLLFAVGGHDGPLVRKSVECFNPEKNLWTPVAEMNFCRRNAGVVAHNGQLYIVGGDDGSTNLQSIEVYSPKTDTWELLQGSMTIGRSYTGVCVIDKPDSY